MRIRVRMMHKECQNNVHKSLNVLSGSLCLALICGSGEQHNRCLYIKAIQSKIISEKRFIHYKMSPWIN